MPTILCVVNEPAARLALESALARMGHRAVAMGDFPSAVDALHGGDIGCIIVDARVFASDAEHFLRVRATRCAHVPMLLLTAVADVEQTLAAVRLQQENAALRAELATQPQETDTVVLTSFDISAAESVLIAHALRATGGNRTRAAALLGVSIRTLRNRLNGPRAVVS